MVADNRYFPWYPHSYMRTASERSIVEGGAFFVIGNGARGSDTIIGVTGGILGSNEPLEHIGIPEIWGIYDQTKVSQALTRTNKVTPLSPQWQMQKVIPWRSYGKIAGQGIYLNAELGFDNGFSFGASTYAMHVTSVQRFTLPNVTIRDMNLLPAEIAQLDAQRRAMNDLLGLTGAQWSKSGMTDTEVHLRYGFIKDYVAKFRKIDVGIFGGLLLPTGVLRDYNNPASVPFGANGHMGFYGGFEGMFELKEDWTLGIRLQIEDLLAKTQLTRMPVNNETILYGAVVGLAKIDPGVTVVFCPSFTMGDLRDGCGAGLQYTLAFHAGDVWTDVRTDQSVPTTLNNMYELSQWTAEYLTASVFYDPNRESRDERTYPILTFKWDIPVKIFGAESVSKTNLISLGFSFHF